MRLIYQIEPARYAKGMMIVRCPSENGLKSRAACLIGHGLNCRYTNRSRGYVASPSKVAKFRKLYREGWDASYMTGELIAPGRWQ